MVSDNTVTVILTTGRSAMPSLPWRRVPGRFFLAAVEGLQLGQ
jgi:hypothetical protein